MYSLLHDIDMYLSKHINKLVHPDKLTRPLVPHMLYAQDLRARNEVAPENILYFKWVCDKFNKLSVREKEEYNKKYDKLHENYLKKFIHFYENNPDERPNEYKMKTIKITPFNLFFTELKDKQGNIKRVDAIKEALATHTGMATLELPDK